MTILVPEKIFCFFFPDFLRLLGFRNILKKIYFLYLLGIFIDFSFNFFDICLVFKKIYIVQKEDNYFEKITFPF